MDQQFLEDEQSHSLPRSYSGNLSLDGGEMSLPRGGDSPVRNNRYYWGHRSRTGNDSDSTHSWNLSPGSHKSGIMDDTNQVRNTLVFTAKRKRSALPFTVIAFCFLGFILYSSAQSTLKRALRDGSRLVAFSSRLHSEVERAHNDMKMLEQKLASLDKAEKEKEDLVEEQKVMEQAALFTNPKMIAEVNALQKKLRISASKATKLKEQVREISKIDAIEKYGAGPHRVEMELIFPGNLAGPTKLIIEMAPIELMPHSVYTFLEMTSLGLIDGCSFILNALHVLKAAPLSFDSAKTQDKAKQFAENGLESVAFREYSPDFPHKRHTLGFAADGTPSFYINTDDNTEIHVSDPCFGKVVSGIDTVKRLESSPTRNGIWFENRIGIKSARIL